MKKSNIESKKKSLIKKIFTFISKNSLSNSPTSIDIFKKQLLELFKLEVASMGLIYKENSKNNDIDLSFELDLTENWVGRCAVDRTIDTLSNQYKISKSKISINEKSMLFHKLYSNSVSERLESCKKILETLYHELKHYNQHEMMSIKYPSKDLIDMEKEYLVLDEMNTDKFYNDNHDSFLFEIDAKLDSYNKIEEYEEYPSRKNTDVVYRKNDMMFSTVVALNNENESEVMDRNTYIKLFVDNIICNNLNSEYLKKYPALTYEYNTNCTRKTIIELYRDYKERIKDINDENALSEQEKNKLTNDIKELYYELFYYQLTKTYDSLFDVFLDKYDSDEIYNFFEEMKNYFRLKRIKKSMISNDNYITKCINKTDSARHIAQNHGYVEVVKGMKKILVDVNEYIKDLDIKSSIEKKRIAKIIPRCGYYILNNGGKVLAIDFLKKLIKTISYDEDEDGVKKIIDYNQLISSLVKPEEEVEHILNLESINRDYQFQTLLLNVQQEHIIKSKTKKVIKKMWKKQSTGTLNKYNLANINLQSISINDEDNIIVR